MCIGRLITLSLLIHIKRNWFFLLFIVSFSSDWHPNLVPKTMIFSKKITLPKFVSFKKLFLFDFFLGSHILDSRLAYSAPGSLAPPGTLHKDFWEGAMAGGPIVPGLGIVGRNLI